MLLISLWANLVNRELSFTGGVDLKAGVKQILGKRIRGVVEKKRPSQPRSQLFLIFTDGTYFEFYTYMDQICGTGGVCVGGLKEVREYLGEEYVAFEA